METIVVGIDGSEGSRAALALAAREATLRNARLRVVVVWEVPATVYGGGFALVDSNALDPLRAQSEKLADESLATVRASHPSVDSEAVVLEGQPAEALLGAATDAALIVVGSRGLGGFKRLVMGSVSDQVMHHAACPVMVVHGGAADD
jgi:nucleotide-binding universal stress UspA family protein